MNGAVQSGAKVAVLAGNSFSGQDFIDLLLEDPGREIVAIGRSPERSDTFASYKKRDDAGRVRYHQLDINSEFEKLCAVLDSEKPDWVVNFAAQGEVSQSWSRPGDWFRTNSAAVAELVKYLSGCDYLKRYLHVSTPEVYGTCTGTVTEDAPFNPSTPYAASKAAGDMAVQLYQREMGLPAMLVRATNVYGARQQLYRIIPRTIIYPKLDRKIQLQGGGKAVKSYIHIRDISRGELAILERGSVGACYHLSPDGSISIRGLIEAIYNISGCSFANCIEDVAERTGQDAAYIIDSTKARSELGWQPGIKLEDGLAEVFEWVEEYWDELKDQSFVYRHKP
jgi:dTDP-glucose 4,6-dehydratase